MDILINTFPDEKVLDGLTFEKVKLKYGTGRSSTFMLSFREKVGAEAWDGRWVVLPGSVMGIFI